jgi:small subunit ribosomal protein S17
MARPRRKTEEETPKAEETEAAEGTEELVSEQTPEEVPAKEPSAEVAEEPVGEGLAPPEATAEEEAPEPEETPEPEAAAEEPAEPVGEGLAPPEATADEEAPEPEETPEPEAAAEAPEEAPAKEEPPAEAVAPAAPAKPKRVRRPKEERRARTHSRKVRRRGTSDGKRKPIVRLPKPEHVRGQRKERRGVVVSNAMEKTIVVRVDTAKPHRRYTKVVRISKKLHAHDEQNEANVGDVVRIVETRPLSKTKHWRLAEVVEQAR